MKFLNNAKKMFYSYGVFFFFFTVVYHLVIINRFHLWSVGAYSYTFYLLDYSFGFCSRFLPGALYHLFFKEVYISQLNVFLTLLLLLVILGISLFFAKLVCLQKQKENRVRVVFLCLFFLSGAGILTLLGIEIGIYETFWVFFALLFLLVVSKKHLKYVIPVFFVLSVLIYYTAMISIVVFFCLVLLYEALQQEGKERKCYYVLLLLSLVLAFGLSLYLGLFEKNNLRYTMEEFNNALEQRNHADGMELNLHYFNNSFYQSTPREEVQQFLNELDPYSMIRNSKLPHALAQAIVYVYVYFRMWIFWVARDTVRFVSTFAICALAALPLMIHFYSYWKQCFKAAQQRSQKLLYSLIMLQYPFSMVFCFLSTDITRWMTHAFAVQFALYLYVAHKNGELAKLKESFLFRANWRALVCYFLFYLLIVFVPLG